MTTSSTPPAVHTDSGNGTGVAVSLHQLTTADAAQVNGVLRRPRDLGSGGTVVSLMHPRQDVTHHRLVDALCERGYAVWTQGSRSPNNDISLLHEQALLDVAAGQQLLEDQGFDSRVVLGHSGGATLFAFYEEQAQLAPTDRLTHAPGGEPVPLAVASMPVPHGSIFLAPHPGQGELLQRLIDPSVTDEDDPLSVDPALDPYRPANGFRAAPDPSTYTDDFIATYRAAQRDRVARIDAWAQENCLANTDPGDAGTGADIEDSTTVRRGLLAHPRVVHRTDADLRSVDPSIDHNQRPYGSLFGRRPDLANYGLAGFARVVTPGSWMSTWSATTSRASFLKNAPAVHTPTLLVEFTGDQACFPADARAMYAAFNTPDKEHVRIPGMHFGQPLAKGEPSGMRLAAQRIERWLDERFPNR